MPQKGRMHELVNQLQSLPGVRLNPPASDEQITAAEAELGSELPQEVRDFYALCDGIVFHECLDVPPLERVVEYFTEMGSGPLSRMFCVMLDEHESNPICLFHQGPLRGYIARISHDGDSYVGWRSLAALLEEIAAQLRQDGRANADKLTGELRGSARTDRDVAASRAIIEFAKNTELDEATRPLAFTFAFDLLGDAQAPDIAAFLEHEDMFVARAARERLAQLEGAEAKAALENLRAEMNRLVQRCVEILRRDGREVTVVNEFDICVGSQRLGLNREAVYSVKNRPDFEQWIIGLVRRT